jgi:hypothetical protein
MTSWYWPFSPSTPQQQQQTSSDLFSLSKFPTKKLPQILQKQQQQTSLPLPTVETNASFPHPQQQGMKHTLQKEQQQTSTPIGKQQQQKFRKEVQQQYPPSSTASTPTNVSAIIFNGLSKFLEQKLLVVLSTLNKDKPMDLDQTFDTLGHFTQVFVDHLRQAKGYETAPSDFIWRKDNAIAFINDVFSFIHPSKHINWTLNDVPRILSSLPFCSRVQFLPREATNKFMGNVLFQSLGFIEIPAIKPFSKDASFIKTLFLPENKCKLFDEETARIVYDESNQKASKLVSHWTDILKSDSFPAVYKTDIQKWTDLLLKVLKLERAKPRDPLFAEWETFLLSLQPISQQHTQKVEKLLHHIMDTMPNKQESQKTKLAMQFMSLHPEIQFPDLSSSDAWTPYLYPMFNQWMNYYRRRRTQSPVQTDPKETALEVMEYMFRSTRRMEPIRRRRLMQKFMTLHNATSSEPIPFEMMNEMAWKVRMKPPTPTLSLRYAVQEKLTGKDPALSPALKEKLGTYRDFIDHLQTVNNQRRTNALTTSSIQHLIGAKKKWVETPILDPSDRKTYQQWRRQFHQEYQRNSMTPNKSMQRSPGNIRGATISTKATQKVMLSEADKAWETNATTRLVPSLRMKLRKLQDQKKKLDTQKFSIDKQYDSTKKSLQTLLQQSMYPFSQSVSQHPFVQKLENTKQKQNVVRETLRSNDSKRKLVTDLLLRINKLKSQPGHSQQKSRLFQQTQDALHSLPNLPMHEYG